MTSVRQRVRICPLFRRPNEVDGWGPHDHLKKFAGARCGALRRLRREPHAKATLDCSRPLFFSLLIYYICGGELAWPIVRIVDAVCRLQRRQEAAIHTNDGKLDLSELDLAELPGAVKALGPRVEDIALDRNSLVEVSTQAFAETFEGLTGLKRINLDSNPSRCGARGFILSATRRADRAHEQRAQGAAIGRAWTRHHAARAQSREEFPLDPPGLHRRAEGAPPPLCEPQLAGRAPRRHRAVERVKHAMDRSTTG